MNLVKEYAKAIAAWVAGVVVSVVINLVNGSTPWPTNLHELVQLLVVSFGPAIAVALQPAKISDKQVEKDPTVVRVPAPADGESPWQP